MNNIIVMVTALIVFGLACRGEDRPGARDAARQDVVNVSEQKGTGNQRGSFSVTIVPEAPLVSTEIDAVCAGKAAATTRWERNGYVLEGEHSSRLPREKCRKGDTVTVVMTAAGETATASVVIRNSLPVVVSAVVRPETIHRGDEIAVAPEAVDPDGDQVGFRYQWSVNGEAMPEDAPVFRTSGLKRGDRVTVSIIPFDGEGAGNAFSLKPFIIPNAAPRFTSVPPREFTGAAYVYQARAEDPDGDEITYTLSSAPQGMTIDEKAGKTEWNVGKGGAGTHAIEIVARDSEGLSISQKYTLKVALPGEAAR